MSVSTPVTNAGSATVPGAGPSPAQLSGIGPSVDLGNWLAARRNGGATPADVTEELVGAGWSADAAATVALRSLRRADRRPLLWFSLCWAAGLAAVGTTTGLHQLLTEYPNRMLAALALTVAVVMAPIAVACGVHARRVEVASEFAVWSPERRVWFGTLATCTVVVGLVRLIGYLYLVIASMVAATDEPLYGRDLAQVALSLGVALPLFWWSFTEWRRSNVAISGLRDDER